MAVWSVQEAKNRFSAVVEAARKEAQTVTKHGRPAVVVVEASEYERLKRLEKEKAPSFTELLLAMPTQDDPPPFDGLDFKPREVEF
ncbi:type II toxin-antitoxin system Phd/YefM family antitoxin [Indioceanicola profundi]|uniref:type II toxin-antitoxin system Phd/YefM family antitoxin n=1 Tax=Indioceanicola profundi TaxID=2220096 RepID=UPI000E6ABF9D|nr:type II toxin-antitoxin system Phd/YefM family antitoxin [Indioceanicola profundi]